MIRDISIKLLLVCSFLISGLIPTMIVSLIGFNTAKSELKEQAFRQLESVRNIKKEQIKNFFSQQITNIEVFSKNPYIIEAFRQLEKAFREAGGVESGRYRGHLEEKYDAPLSYKQVHDGYFNYFKYLIRQYGYYDFFLMDFSRGDTVFTVKKESDFGIRIGEVSSSLRDVWLITRGQNSFALSDTKPYPPSNNAPAQFLAAPIRDKDGVIGVAAVQISIDSIDNIMKERSGMWNTGETYLVGRDKKMRSDSYMDGIHHSVYASFNGTVADNGVDTRASRQALDGITGTGIIRNYRGRKVLSSYTPIDIGGVKWAMIAEIDLKEVEQQIADALNTKIIVLFVISTAVLLVLSMIISVFISKGIKNTIGQLEHMIKEVLKGKADVRGDTDSVGSDFKEVVAGANQLIDAFTGQWEEKRKLEEHIQYNQKLKAIGTLAGGIAHDFNNILTSLFAYSHIVMAELPETAEMQAARENMEEIITGLRRASELVEQILTFGRQTETETRIINVCDMVSGTLKLLKATLPKNISISFRLCEEALYIDSAPSGINQILMNLCTNASYAMRESGGVLEITVSKSVESGAGDGTGGEQGAGALCRLTVKDSGQGIAPEIRERIFEPFFTTKPVGQGSGMGLSMVHGIVSAAGGRIEVESVPGDGATFHVYLPLVEPGSAASRDEALVQAVPGAGRQILFIDDDVRICDSQSRVLEMLGYRVTTLSDPRDAERLVGKEPGRFQLVVTDLNMPHINGIELARKLSALRPGLPIILSTGNKDYNQLIETVNLDEAGISALLKKPYEKAQLSQAIAENLNKE